MAGSGGPGDGPRWRVFLSHTSELRNFPGKGTSYVAQAERAVSAAGHAIVDMADFPAADQPAAQVCAELVRGCEVYVGILGTRYGSPVRDKTEVSYTELEFDTATTAGLPRLVFLLDKTAEPIPEDLFTSAPDVLPGELAARAADPLAWRQTLAHLTRQSLARIDQRGLVMHRLTQAILRDRLTPEQAAATRACTEAILATADPGDPGNPATWPRWAQLMPHLLAADLAATENEALRWMACNACWYLLARGDTHPAYDLATDLRQHWRDRLGDDHEHVLTIVEDIAHVFRDMGRYTEARDLHQDVLDRSRRILGADDPRTLNAANNFVNDLRFLGEYQVARELAEDTLARRRRVLGADHDGTLTSASEMAANLRMLGEVVAARDLDQDTLDRRRRLIGADHPETLLPPIN